MVATPVRRNPGYAVLTWVIASSSAGSGRPGATSGSVSMATVRVARISRSRSSARSAYRPNQNRSDSTRGTMATDGDPAATGPASSSTRPRRATTRAAATGSRLTTQTSLDRPPSGSVTSGARRPVWSSVTRARPPSIAV